MSSPAQHADPNADLDSNTNGNNNNNLNSNTNTNDEGNNSKKPVSAFQGKKQSNITPFRVFARVRPFIATELEGTTSDKLRSCVEMIDNKTILLNPNEDFAPKAEYAFDESFWSIPGDYAMKRVFADTERKPYASQKTVYDETAGSCADLAMEGINSCVMMYGQTGTGKTFSMLGTYNPYDVKGGEGPEGIIPRVCLDVLTNVESKNKELGEKKKKGEIPSSGEGEISYSVDVSFIEVYMEKCRDLLDLSLKGRKDAENNAIMKEAKIRLDPESGPYIEGLTKYPVASWADICPLLERGQSMRRTSATTVHQQSSRSHAIFQITITEETKLKPKFIGGAPQISKKTGRINLVDLAGSERGGHQDYVKESAQINKSLLTLRRVIDQLVEKQNAFFEKMRQELTAAQSPNTVGVLSPTTPGASPSIPPSTPSTSPASVSAAANSVVPYRESVLTWLLSDSIGGNACTTMIAALSPHQKNFQETYSTLLWSSKARGLVSVVKVNDVNKSVTQGMGNKLLEMEERLSLQKQNVDIIRQELTLKGDMIAQMEADLRRTQEATRRANEGTANFVAIAAALTIQRGHLASRQGKSIGKLTSAIATVEDELESSEAEYVHLQQNRVSLERTLADERDKLGQSQSELGSLKAILAELKKQDEINQVEYEKLKKEQEESEALADAASVSASASAGQEEGATPRPAKKETMDEMKNRFQEEVRLETERAEKAKQHACEVDKENAELREKQLDELQQQLDHKKNDPAEVKKREDAIKDAQEFEGTNKTLGDEVRTLADKKKQLEAKLKQLTDQLKAKQKK